MINKWDKRFLELAYFVSGWSKDPSTKVGAVIARPDNSVCSVGFNGFPKGIEDTKERLENRDLKYKLVVHGEINALCFASEDIAGYTLYTIPFMPCSKCAGIFIQKKISRVVAPWSANPRWIDEFELATKMFNEAGITVEFYSGPLNDNTIQKHTDSTPAEAVSTNRAGGGGGPGSYYVPVTDPGTGGSISSPGGHCPGCSLCTPKREE